MKFTTVLIVLLACFVAFVSRAWAGERISPEDASRRLASGNAVLIDVREPEEWQEGVAQPALLLPLSDLRRNRKAWADVLEQNRDKELILYCRSGNRSGIAARILEKEGHRVTNAGGFAEWRDAGLPVRKP